jgi:putative DNA primase/helicase
MSSEEYDKHYEKYLPIYEDLAMVNGGKTVWIPTDAHDGWYVSSPVSEDEEAWERGYPNKSKPSILPDNLSSDVERTAYTTITYAPDKSYKSKYYKETEYDEDNQGYEWMDGDSQRLPDYGDMVAWALYVDIDIKKDYKKRPIPDEHKEVLERRLNLWVQAFAKMTGSMEHVQLLDSGGGVYVFTPPSVLSPIADKYDKEERELIFTEIGERMRTVTGQLNELICNEDDSPDELFSADKVQNKNRQFKTIGAIHKTIDAIVHPIDPDNIQIKHKKREDITDRDIGIAHEWVNNFTDDSHRECIDNVIEYLFQGQFTKREDVELEFVEGTTWDDILDTWVDEKKTKIEQWEASLKEQKDISQEQLHTGITQDKSLHRESIRRLNNDKLKAYITHFVGADNVYEKSGNEMDFFPFWRGSTSQSGRSAFYDFYEGSARFTDKADGTSRDIVYWVALEMTHDDKNYPDVDIIDNPGEKLGSGYWTAVEELRNRGEKIPILVPKPNGKGSLPEWAIIQAGKKLDIVEDKEIVTIDGDEKLIPSAWNRVLDKLDEEDIIHNCERRKYVISKNMTPAYEEYDLEEETESDIDDIFYKSSDYVWLMPEFDSAEEFENFLDKLPDDIILFSYEDDIAGGSADGLLLGSFINSDDDTKATLMSFEPFPLQNIDSITSHNDLTIQDKYELDKTKMTVFIKPEDKRN